MVPLLREGLVALAGEVERHKMNVSGRGGGSGFRGCVIHVPHIKESRSSGWWRWRGRWSDTSWT